MGYGWHAYATDEQHAVPRRILHAYHATATEILHSRRDACSTKMDCTADHPQTWHAHCQTSTAHATADVDGPTRRAGCCAHASQARTGSKLQVYSYSQESSSTDGWSSCARSAWSSTPTASCDDPGSGASDCYYVGCCSYARAEADVGREIVSSDPQDAPRSGG